MAELATTIGIKPQTARLTAVAVARGVRLALDSSGTCAVTGANTIRGDYVTLQSGVASEVIAVTNMQDGQVMALAGPALTNNTTAIGEVAYAVATTGTFTNSSASSAVAVGRWTSVTANDQLGSVQLFTVA